MGVQAHPSHVKADSINYKLKKNVYRIKYAELNPIYDIYLTPTLLMTS